MNFSYAVASIIIACSSYRTIAIDVISHTAPSATLRSEKSMSVNDGNKGDAELSIVGRWTSIDGKVHIIINAQDQVIQQGQTIGHIVLPCCGNFSFRRYDDKAVYKYDDCNYWIYFNKDKSLSGWYGLKGVDSKNCPNGVFRRDSILYE